MASERHQATTRTNSISWTEKSAPFVRGGLSGVLSWIVIHPCDVVKVRMQLAGEGSTQPPYRGFAHAMRSIGRSEGMSALYAGLSAALTRQVTYTTLRLGLYASLRDSWAQRHDGRVSLSAKFGVGMLSGAVASGISTPVEVAMVRMYNQSASSRGYRNIADALQKIATQEGVAGLWRGATPTIVRSMVVNCVQLGTYDAAKERILSSTRLEDGVSVHLVASTLSGFCYSVATLPIDSAKTRMQNQHANPDGSLPYRSLVHTVAKVGRQEGVLSLWRGFMPYFSRCAGHTVIMFLVLEQVKKLI